MARLRRAGFRGVDHREKGSHSRSLQTFTTLNGALPDLSEAEWYHLKACSRAAISKAGRLRVHGLRDVFDTIFYVR